MGILDYIQQSILLLQHIRIQPPTTESPSHQLYLTSTHRANHHLEHLQHTSTSITSYGNREYVSTTAPINLYQLIAIIVLGIYYCMAYWAFNPAIPILNPVSHSYHLLAGVLQLFNIPCRSRRLYTMSSY